MHRKHTQGEQYLLIFWKSSSTLTAFLALVSMKIAAIDSANSFASFMGTSLRKRRTTREKLCLQKGNRRKHFIHLVPECGPEDGNWFYRLYVHTTDLHVEILIPSPHIPLCGVVFKSLFPFKLPLDWCEQPTLKWLSWLRYKSGTNLPALKHLASFSGLLFFFFTVSPKKWIFTNTFVKQNPQNTPTWCLLNHSCFLRWLPLCPLARVPSTPSPTSSGFGKSPGRQGRNSHSWMWNMYFCPLITTKAIHKGQEKNCAGDDRLTSLVMS